jgi:hypothetical protein
MNRTFLTLLSGIAIGILVAPAKGSETLEKVSGKLTEFKNQLVDMAENICAVEKGTDEYKQSESSV